MPDVRVGTAGIAVLTRCEDDGKVDLQVWSGDPGATPPGWTVLVEAELETVARGFSAGTGGATVIHIKAVPGTYRVRAEVKRDSNACVDGVRFIFPDSEDLEGEIKL